MLNLAGIQYLLSIQDHIDIYKLKEKKMNLIIIYLITYYAQTNIRISLGTQSFVLLLHLKMYNTF